MCIYSRNSVTGSHSITLSAFVAVLFCLPPELRFRVEHPWSLQQYPVVMALIDELIIVVTDHFLGVMCVVCDLIRFSTSCGWLHLQSLLQLNVLNGVLQFLTNGSRHSIGIDSHYTQFPPAVSKVDCFISFSDSRYISDAFSSASSKF